MSLKQGLVAFWDFHKPGFVVTAEQISFSAKVRVLTHIRNKIAQPAIILGQKWALPYHSALSGIRPKKAKQVSERIDHADYFGRRPTTRAPDGLMLSPPFAPDAFWWA
jgi:hypothetical protein